jgi:hypothetical protein
LTPHGACFCTKSHLLLRAMASPSDVRYRLENQETVSHIRRRSRNRTPNFVQTPRHSAATACPLVQREAPDGVFTDAAEVEGAVVFEDVGDFGVAVRGAVLEVFDDAAALVQAEDE